MRELLNRKCLIGTAQIGTNGHIFLADNGLYAFVKYDKLESLLDIVSPEDRDKVAQTISRVHQGKTDEIMFRMVPENGEVTWVIASFKLADRQMYGQTAIRVDISNAQEISERVSELEERLEDAIDCLGIMDAVLLQYEPDKDELKIFSTEKRATYFFVGKIDEFARNRIKQNCIYEDHIHIFEELCNGLKKSLPQIKVEFKAKLLGVEDDYKWYKVVGKTLTDDGRKKTIARLEIKNDDDTLIRDVQLVANTKDFGTGLANKGTILSYAKSLIESQPNHNVAIVIIDLDNFKNINDTYGHKFGDEVLARTAHIIQDAVGDHGMAGRIGGDEMFIVYDNVENDAELRGLLRTIRTNVEWSYKGIRDELEISCSIGACCYPLAGKTFDELFEKADKLLYLAKEKGRNRYIIYVPEIHDEYLNGNMKTTVRELDRIQYNKTGIVNEVIEAARKGEDLLSEERLERVARCFELDDISIIDGKTHDRICGFGYLTTRVDHYAYLEEESYQDLFDENDICTINHISFVGIWSKTANEILKQEKVNAMIQYRHLVNGEEKGYVSFKKSRFSKKWTEMDISLLTIIAKVISLVVF